MTKKIVNLKLVDLDRSNLCQSRVTTDPERLAEYQLAWQTEGTEFPPCIIYQDGDKYYIADGFHRIQSKMLARLETRQERRTIECEVRQGTIQDAITYSLGANLRHGLRPNTSDKKRAILLYYSLSPKHCAHSNNQVAQTVGCSHTFVGAWKATSISTPLDITFAETKIPIEILKQTIANLKAAIAEGKIVTVRNGEPLVQSLKVSVKALEPDLYIVTTTTSAIPRGTVIEGFESLTDTGNIVTDWKLGAEVFSSQDLIKIPYSIDAKVVHIDGAVELAVTSYSLVGDDLKIKCTDRNGYEHNHSSTMLKPYQAKKSSTVDEDKPTPPILDLRMFTTDQLRDIIATIGHEIYRRSLPENAPDLTIT